MRELNQEIEGLHEAKEAEHHQACRALGLSVGMVLRYRHITSHTRNMDIKRRMFANWRRFVEEVRVMSLPCGSMPLFVGHHGAVRHVPGNICV